jgi:hypothetical protein
MRTPLDWGLVVIAVVQVVLVGMRLGARGRRLNRVLSRRLPVGSVYADKDADGSVLRVEFGSDAAAAPRESGGRDA